MNATETRYKNEQEEFTAKLRETVKPGQTVYTILRGVSSSGMTRWLDLYVMEDNQPFRITYWVAKAIGMTYDKKREALKIGGCGMDMGFAAVYDLSRVLFRDGFDCIGRGCPANDHSNGDRNYEPHKHNDGGYALNQRWM